jgi:hypothetical protein
MTDKFRLDGVLRDEGGLLPEIQEHPLPKGVEQKISSTGNASNFPDILDGDAKLSLGKRYLALQVPTVPPEEKPIEDAEDLRCQSTMI